MADIEYSYTPEGMNLQTGGGNPLYNASGGSGNWDSLFAQLAARKAAKEKAGAREEARRFEIEDRRRQEAHDAQMAALSPEKAAPVIRSQGAQQWQKDIPGMGTVPVAPGTPGAYPVNIAANKSDVQDAAKLGLTPGLAGVDFTTLWKGAQDFSQSPGDLAKAKALQAASGTGPSPTSLAGRY